MVSHVPSARAEIDQRRNATLVGPDHINASLVRGKLAPQRSTVPAAMR
jgi:hypothetical protein